MTCPDCGGPISSRDYECPLCGAELQTMTGPSYRPAAQSQPQPQPQPRYDAAPRYDLPQQYAAPAGSMWETGPVPLRTAPARPPWLPMAIIAGVVVIGLVAAFFLFRPGGDPKPSVADPGTTGTTTSGDTGDTGDTGSSGDSGDSGDTGNQVSDSGPTVDLAASATVSASATANSNVDGNGSGVSYDASNMQDGRADTTWRMNGDGSGSTITIDLGGTHTITSVGLINGYAKTDPGDGTNRYYEERRITQVTWTIGGQSIDQSLADSTSTMQTVAVPSLQAAQVMLTIDSTTAPGDRDYTAISELQVAGS